MKAFVLALCQLLLIQLCLAHSPVLLWPAQDFDLPKDHSALQLMPADAFAALFANKKVIIFTKRTFNLEEVSDPTKPLSYLETVDAFAMQGVKAIHRLITGLAGSENLKFVSLTSEHLQDDQDLIKETMESNPGFSAILVGTGTHRRKRAITTPNAYCQDDQKRMIFIESATNSSGEALTPCVIQDIDDGYIIKVGNLDLVIKKDGEGFSLSAENYTFDQENRWAPNSFSYSCAELVIRRVNAPDFITLSGFQVFPNKTTDNVFPESFDCSSWFTSTIWMGLLISLFYIGILFVAILYLLDVKVNDRFDDPKGKTITVNVSE